MNYHRLALPLLVGACLLLSACQDRREPVKPTVTQAAAVQQRA